MVKVGIRWEAKGDYFASGDLAYQIQEIIRATEELLKKRARLNIITHLLSQVPYKPPAHRDITLPKRQPPGGYREPDLPLRYIPTPF